MIAHTLDKTDAVAETCMAPGNIDYWTCSVCGHIFSNSTATNQITADETVIPKHAHNLSKSDAVAETCTANGNIDYWTCSECHNYFSNAEGTTQITADDTVVSKHAHTLSKTNAVSATCTATGNIDYWTCSECHNYFSDENGNTQITAEQRIIPMVAHTLDKTDAVAETCMAPGNIDYWTCSVCGHIFSNSTATNQITADDTVVPKHAHNLSKTDAVSATCTATGNIDYWTCSECHNYFSDANGNTQITAEQRITPIVAHTLSKTDEVAETCTANGNIDYWTCSVCHKFFSDEGITQIDEEETVIPKHAHTLSKTDAVESTCTATGNIDYWTCSECHNYFSDANGNTQITAEQRITAMKAHTLVKTNAVSATCTEQGNIDYWTCSVCTHIFSDEGGNTQITAEQTVTAMIAHTLVKTNANAATCTATGNIDYWTCSVCSHIFSDANGNTQITAEQTVTAMVAHTLNKTNAVAETCTANGNIDYWTCSICGHIFSDSTAETQITADDTVIPKHAHTLSKTDAVAATCTATGNIDYWTCSECHNYFSDANGNIQITPEQRITPMIAHTLNKTDAVAETCTAYGNINYWTCSVCGHIFSDANGNTQITSEETVVPKHAHNLTKTNAVAETCTANGNINYWTCSECGNYFSDANGNTQITAEETVVPKHAHTLNKTNAVAETCTANGNIDYWTCSECGNYFSNAEGTTQITEEQTVVAKHAHTLAKTNAVAATCTAEGNIDYWTCSECENYFSDANGNTQITAEQRITAMIAHTLVKTNAVAATCTAEGNTDYWTCSVCGHIFSDSTGETQITAEQTVTAMIAHTIIPVEAAESTCTEQGHIAHYKCTACNKVFTDEQGENETTVDAVTLDLVPHTIVYVEAVPATTTATGNKEHYKCTVCGKLFSDEEGTNEVTLASVTIKKKTSGGGGGGSSTPTTYRISTKVINEGGSISPENPKAEKGDTIKFTITVNDGYEIMDVLVDDVSVGSVETYTLSNIKDAHSINVKFAKIPEEVDNPDEGNNNSEGENNQEGNNQEGENNSEGENNQEENNQEGSNQEENNQEEGNNTGNGSGSSKPTVTDFVDLSEDAWYYKPIKHVVEKGLFSGVTKTEFAPKQNLTRAMLVTVLYKYDEAKDTNLADFLDVSKTAYFSAPIAWANKNGIVSGIGSNMFAPKTDITRQDLVTILYKYARFKDKNVEISEDEVDLSNYEDAETIAEYAKPAVRWAVKNGILSGRTPTTIVPKGTATRAEAAALMQRIDKIFK
ncbi:MAG: S-layer homology domain-containing protein [Clostridia bacterium]|nr:S-layer homology domain-containing protein [Clostridia bacterium]